MINTEIHIQYEFDLKLSARSSSTAMHCCCLLIDLAKSYGCFDFSKTVCVIRLADYVR